MNIKGPSQWTRLLAILFLVMGSIGYHCESEDAMEDRVDATTLVLHIALQDGFDNELVVVRVNGEEVYRREEVLTNPRIGLADSFEMPAQETPLLIEVRLPDKQIADSLQVDVTATPNVGVSYLDGALRFKLSEIPFGYL